MANILRETFTWLEHGEDTRVVRCLSMRRRAIFADIEYHLRRMELFTALLHRKSDRGAKGGEGSDGWNGDVAVGLSLENL